MKKLLKQRFLPLLFGMLLSMPVVFGQNQVAVKGTVVDQDGQPVIGAGIMVKGTTNGVTTDLDGNFSILVPARSVLEISSIGYVTQEVTAAPVLNITMREDVTHWDED